MNTNHNQNKTTGGITGDLTASLGIATETVELIRKIGLYSSEVQIEALTNAVDMDDEESIRYLKFVYDTGEPELIKYEKSYQGDFHGFDNEEVLMNYIYHRVDEMFYDDIYSIPDDILYLAGPDEIRELVAQGLADNLRYSTIINGNSVFDIDVI